MPHVNKNEMSTDNLSEELRHTIKRNGVSVTEDNVGTVAESDTAVTPSNSGMLDLFFFKAFKSWFNAFTLMIIVGIYQWSLILLFS